MTTIRAAGLPEGTLIQTQPTLLPIRRRPAATIGLPWKRDGGARYDHDEIDQLLAEGATVIRYGYGERA